MNVQTYSQQDLYNAFCNAPQRCISVSLKLKCVSDFGSPVCFSVYALTLVNMLGFLCKRFYFYVSDSFSLKLK